MELWTAAKKLLMDPTAVIRPRRVEIMEINLSTGTKANDWSIHLKIPTFLKESASGFFK